MNAILGFSEILIRPNLAREKQTLYAEVLNAASNQLLGIINDILDISKIETGQVTVHKGEVSVNQILRSVQSLFIHNAKNKGNYLLINQGLTDVKSQIITDESKLTQIITNLVSNAIKFTNKGKIEFGYVVNNGNLDFYVEDTGIGISDENQTIVFERFRQADMTPSRNYGGTGLGLSICKAFVEMLGGSIGVKSVEGKGSRFYFSIPYNSVESSKADHLSKPKTNYNFSAATILVAEDEPHNFIFLSELLRETEVKIIHAENGAKAVELFSLNTNIDLILMDIKMPVLNGLKATNMIRKIDSKVPIIALTAYAMAGDKENCLEAGCNAYLSKPLIKDDLLVTIDSYLKRI
jgi:CheY-like chemotaxis protein